MKGLFIHIVSLLLYPLYFFSGFTKRDSKIWIFSSNYGSFRENSKYFFLYVHSLKSDIRPIFITNNEDVYEKLLETNYEVYMKWSLKGLYYSLKAKVYIYSSTVLDINYWTSKNTLKINLWHGIPLKHIMYSVNKGREYKKYNTKYKYIYMLLKPYEFVKPDYVLTTSEFTNHIFSEAFDVNISKCLPLGYPRTDVFFWDKEQEKSYFQQFPSSVEIDNLKKYNNVLIYMPTWREYNPNFFNDAFPDLNIVSKILNNNNDLLLLKLHPNTRLNIDGDFANIKVVSIYEDIYPILKYTSFLITDYSSIYFDYLLLDKEILFYCFDLEDYENNDRSFYFDYQNNTPGKKIYSFDELLYSLNNLNELDYRDERKHIMLKFWDKNNNSSSKKLFNFLTKNS